MTQHSWKVKFTASFLLTLMIGELIAPTKSHALTSGPVQPEIQSFEPVGTTDMVDPFTGDFVYNIPLLDVEGYPVNISYHGGVTMEQEASWVGLGWNINPGAINRAVRGLPDDFDGDSVQKTIHIKPEVTNKIGMNFGGELMGSGSPLISLDANLGGVVTMNNYRGVSVDFYVSAGLNTSFQMVSAGLNVGASVGSQSGAAVNYGANASLGMSKSIAGDMSASGSFNLNTGGTYSPRGGLRRDAGMGASLTISGYGNRTRYSTNSSVPIGLQNYTAVVSNASYMNTYAGRLKLGGELFGGYLNGNVNASRTKITFEENGSRRGYGYFHLDHASDQDILDFSREKDGYFNTTMHFLPQSTMTYDVYSVSGQGTGGSFRPFRNDMGSVFDPVTSSEQSNQSVEIEGGLGNAVEFGGEYDKISTKVQSGPWQNYQRKFHSDTAGAYEDYYYKEAGELTSNNTSFLSGIGSVQAVTPPEVMPLPEINGNANTTRVARANMITSLTARPGDIAAYTDRAVLESFNDTNGFRNYPVVTKSSIDRTDNVAGRKLGRKVHHINEIVQTQKDGRRYVYGLPVVNNVQREVTFAVENGEGGLNERSALIKPLPGSDSKANNRGLDNFYSSTVTPTYVTAHLLTQVLSADYIDVTGNGVSDDDRGSYTKFNYTRKDADYRWRSPIQEDSAQFSKGYYSDKKDDKGSYMIGSREQWMLHSIETKNFVAEFYVSKRSDGRGVRSAVLRGGEGTYDEAPYNIALSEGGASYKLDSIALYNKHDRFMHGSAAVPIKTVIFKYSYELCRSLPNSVQTGNEYESSGKLTLKGIYTRFGNSNLSMHSPYIFNYSELNPDYDIGSKDKWGGYKPNTDPLLSNFEYPFSEQDPVMSNYYASAWSLVNIHLPSGGDINVTYEADDYAYVQDREAMSMFRLAGIGSAESFSSGSQLYFSASQPNLYLYFKRRKAAENRLISMKANYLNGTDLLYYNVPVELKPGSYEPIKGYAEVEKVDSCTNDPDYGYIKLKPKTLQGTSTQANPITYTALNLGRYSLPHIIFPGADPEQSSIANVAAGLKSSIKQLVQMHKNPLGEMMKQGQARNTEPQKGFVRLTAPGLKKKGGGQRVRKIEFSDRWSGMVGSTAPTATYGKIYDYTIPRQDGKGSISSGVASYEPMIGGDEIPLRSPVNYTVQEGNSFPPNDPVELYQENPLGESFYPGPVVGYSRVSVRSIHQAVSKSAQGEDVYGYYTARDFPVITSATPIASKKKTKFGLQGVEVDQEATQGFSIVLNDMHGKPSYTEHWVLKPNSTANSRELINSQQFRYRQSGGALSNQAPIYLPNSTNGRMTLGSLELGRETDITVDTRLRKEESKSIQISGNINGFLVAVFPVVIPLVYPWNIENSSEFRAATVTKVTQQYGIIDQIIQNNEGAVTNMRNEVFDPNTGSAVVTSINNEYGDREYTAQYPAYWAYKNFGPSYVNHNRQGAFEKMFIEPFSQVGINNFYNYNSGLFPLQGPNIIGSIPMGQRVREFNVGDEILLWLDANAAPVKVWVLGYRSAVVRPPATTGDCELVVGPRMLLNGVSDGWKSYNGIVSNVSYRIIRSGNRNQLGETMQTIVSTKAGNINGVLADKPEGVVSIQAQTFDYSTHMSTSSGSMAVDTLNPMLSGRMHQFRPYTQYVNIKDRTYATTTSRDAGLFDSYSFFLPSSQWGASLDCGAQKSLPPMAGGTYTTGGAPNSIGDNWKPVQTARKYNHNGMEVENQEQGVGYNSAVYGYNQQLPVCVAKNARYGEVLFESFEDATSLVENSIPDFYKNYLKLFYSPFEKYFQGLLSITNGSATSTYKKVNPVSGNLTLSQGAAHTGFYSLMVAGASPTEIVLPTDNNSSQFGETERSTFRLGAHPNFVSSGSTKYVVNLWLRPVDLSAVPVNNTYSPQNLAVTLTNPAAIKPFSYKSGVIDGWQQYEVVFELASTNVDCKLVLPTGYYYDDIRIFPYPSNSKGFVYHPVTRKLMASLDENNYATFYEYDDEGNLIRTKKETERGVQTLTEARRSHPNN